MNRYCDSEHCDDPYCLTIEEAEQREKDKKLQSLTTERLIQLINYKYNKNGKTKKNTPKRKNDTKKRW